ncbi:MAG TPA: phosphopyruvate hydratase [Candidatus Bilamarchaeum sp.]|nr:phosphopyruvate hydratase [Candidatus Bilamarchaeum sp.]
MKISSVWAREILDSRGNPTVEVDVLTENSFASAAAPSGASTGKHEAVELRDGGRRYSGKGVLKAVDNVNTVIAPALIGMDCFEQQSIDQKLIDLDGTENKSRLGANAMVATSMAVLRAAAASEGKMLHDYLGGATLPFAMFNIINGGKHAGNKLAIQEFMIIPKAELFTERLQMASEIYHVLGKKLVEKYGPSAKNVGDEGGYAPAIDNTYKALDSIMDAIGECGYGQSVTLAIDAAASSFHDEKTGLYQIDGKELKETELVDYYADLCKNYPIKSIEDPFFEESFPAFAALRKEVHDVQIVGDDLTVTNVERLKMAISQGSISALLLKLNQIGTVTEAMAAVKMCRENQLNVIVSHRSGETEDCFISDFSVGINAGQIKTGAPARGERTAKYNQLLRIEEKMHAEEA